MQTRKHLHPALWLLILLATIPVLVLLAEILFFGFLEEEPLSLRVDPEPPPPPVEVVDRIEGIEDRVIPDGVETDPPVQTDPPSHLYKGIQARVVDAVTGTPVTSFTVYYCSEEGAGPEHDIEMILRLSDKARAFRGRRDGVMRIFGLEDGKYSLAIKAAGYSTFIQRELEVPQKEKLLVFELPRGTYIEGKVMDVEGKPVPDMAVHLSVELDDPDDDPPARRVARTDHQGMFLFGGLPPGRYGLALNSLARPLAEAQGIYLGPGGHRYQELYIPMMTRLEFMVTDAFGGALPNASIRLWSRDGTTVINLTTDMYGKAARDLVPAGDYELRISKNTYDPHIDKNFQILQGMPIIQVTRTLVKR